MNTSPYINPDLCRKCGECCLHFDIWFPRDAHASIRSEIQRFKLLAGIGDKISEIEEENGSWLRFNIPCKHLQKDDEGYRCEIYSDPNRPLLCREYPYHWKDHHCPQLLGEWK